MSPAFLALYVAADDAFQVELVRVYGRDAGDARYDARGTATPKLDALAARKLAADRELRAARDAVAS